MIGLEADEKIVEIQLLDRRVSDDPGDLAGLYLEATGPDGSGCLSVSGKR